MTALHRFLHVSFMFPGVPKVRDLEPVFYATGDDWIRYSITSWIIWTAKPAVEIFARIKPHLDVSDQVLIVKLDMSDGFGWLSPWIWTWMQSKMPTVLATGPVVQDALQQFLPPPTPPVPWSRK